jgi:putative intracellular protease/amidase
MAEPGRDREAWLADAARMALLADTARPDAIDPADFDAIYFTGGHAVMWAFHPRRGCSASRATSMNAVASFIRVPRLLRPARNPLSDGSLLVAGRRLTGFSVAEEAGRRGRQVPYNAER